MRLRARNYKGCTGRNREAAIVATGEPSDLRKSRLTRRKDYVEPYGPALIESRAYQAADDDLKAKMLKRIADRTNGLANKRDPDLGELDADSIARGIRKSEKSTEKRRERSRERLIYAPQ